MIPLKTNCYLMGVNYNTAWNWLKDGAFPYTKKSGIVVVSNDVMEAMRFLYCDCVSLNKACGTVGINPNTGSRYINDGAMLYTAPHPRSIKIFLPVELCDNLSNLIVRFSRERLTLKKAFDAIQYKTIYLPNLLNWYNRKEITDNAITI